MNTELVDQIVNAVLYEGYLLYPYRRCIKNHKRLMFGCLYPSQYCEWRSSGESSSMQTQCLLEGNDRSQLEVQVRFLHLADRRIARLPDGIVLEPKAITADCSGLEYVNSLEIDGTLHQPGQEALECRIETGLLSLEELATQPRQFDFGFPSSQIVEPLERNTGTARLPCAAAISNNAVAISRQETLTVWLECSARRIANDLFSVTIKIENRSICNNQAIPNEAAQLQSLLSTHTILHVDGGRFVSSIGPPEHLRESAAQQRNQGTWPVLVGQPGQRDTVLSSPIILYDYPQAAAESPGDLFDATEIDEILSLRIMTLTDDEKRHIRNADRRAEAILERTENLPEDQFRKLHGAIRGLKRLQTTEH